MAIADKVIEAVQSGAIKKFVVMAGCDGRQKKREYYTEFAKKLPRDTIILALLYLGVKNIKLGPTLPAFLSPGVLKVLAGRFSISTISSIQQDISELLGEIVEA